MKVYSNGILVSGKPTLLNTWKNDFKNLYNKPADDISEYDKHLYMQMLNIKKDQEHDMSSPQYQSNRMLIDDISFDEVQKITNRLKNNKSSGIDKVPNEVMKKYDVPILLWNMYRLFFSYGLTPSVWRKSTISPIPKGSTKDPYAPLHYRGISLLS